MVNDLGHKIRRSKERLKLTQLEQAAAAGISPVSTNYTTGLHG